MELEKSIVSSVAALSQRPHGYNYWDQLIEHIRGPSVIFNGEMVYPRQLEIHLPGDLKRPCNFNCGHCAGRTFQKDLSGFEMDGLELLHKLGDKIPFHIYGGSYTEPILSPFFMSYLSMTKRSGCHFGIHTNGSTLLALEQTQGWLTRLASIATDNVDYLSISLDAGYTNSHCRVKGVQGNFFNDILAGIRLFSEIRRGKPALRLCYLMNETNSSQKEIDRIVAFARSVDADSIRFSIPFANYNQPFSIVREYRDNFEQKHKNEYYQRITPHLSTNKFETPFVFWMSPDFQDIQLFDFEQCAYGYYQICLGADGYIYPCTTVSTPSFKQLRLAKISGDLGVLEEAIKRNQNPEFNCQTCFKLGARCNRMGIECNRGYAEYKETHTISKGVVACQ